MDSKLEILLQYIERLRSNGVLVLKVDGMEVTLAPKVEAVPVQDEPVSQLPPKVASWRNDPNVFGLPRNTDMSALKLKKE